MRLKSDLVMLKVNYRLWWVNVVFKPVPLHLGRIVWLFTETFIEPNPLEGSEHWRISDPRDPGCTIGYCMTCCGGKLCKPINYFIPRMMVVSLDMSPGHFSCRCSSLQNVDQ